MIAGMHQFFETNETIVWFVYGLVFFTLGLAIALQSRSHSRLEMARYLGWLAAFGVTHGLHEWGGVFVPIQATYLPDAAVSFLVLLQTFLLGLSFAFLLQFGVELLRRRWPRLKVLPLVLFTGWLLAFFVPGVVHTASVSEQQALASIWARYLMGAPASILSAIGLQYQINTTIRPLGFRNIARTMHIASLALAGYSFFGGFIVPPASFPPASWLNDQTFVAWVGLPPPVIRSFIGLVLALAMIRTLEVFDIEVDQIIEEMQVERELVEERERIARELHDGTIQTIYTAGLLVESIGSKIRPDKETAGRLERVGSLLNEAIANLRGYIGNLQPQGMGESLEAVIRNQTEDARLNSLVEIQVEMDKLPEEPFNAARLPHVAAILTEALSNAARHSGSRSVKVSAACEDGQCVLSVEDDGRGFDSAAPKPGYGLRNMRDRARLLAGSLDVVTQPGKGTRITLRIPWREEA